MESLLKTLRPVGNKIYLQFQDFDNNIFLPFHSQLYQSGTASLAAALIASHKIKPHINSPEVIIPAYGCPDLVSAIEFSGATPVLVDLELNLPWMSIESILSAITKNTTALVAVNFLGITERMDILREVCQKNNIILVEDSAQGFPITQLTSYWNGDFNIISFGRGKPVNLLSGGAVLCKDQRLLDFLPTPTPQRSQHDAMSKYLLKLFLYNISINPFIYNIVSRLPGINIGKTIYKRLPDIFSMPDYAVKLLAQNIRMFRLREHRNDTRIEYLHHLSSPNIYNLVLATKHDYTKPLLRYPFLVNSKELRDELYSKLKPFGASLMYKTTLDKIEGIPHYKTNQDKIYPNANTFSNSLITLPAYEGISITDIQSIHAILATFITTQ